MLVTMKEMLQKARREGYGVIAPSIHDSDSNMAMAIEAAEELRSPVILNIGYKAFEDLAFMIRIARMRAERATVPVAINQDHGGTFEDAMRCIHYGYTSIMADRSMLDFEENVRQVAEIVKVAHACGVSVEAELGHVGVGMQYAVDRDAALTDPKLAREYVERTNVDFLAVAVGTAHGVYSGTPHLDFPRLEAIAKEVEIPLVLHGGSGTGDELLGKACTMGISKINVGTECRHGAANIMRDDAYKDEAYARPFRLIAKGYKDVVMHYMKIFGSVGKA
jgi:fructose-bisphosphate aldolase class II